MSCSPVRASAARDNLNVPTGGGEHNPPRTAHVPAHARSFHANTVTWLENLRDSARKVSPHRHAPHLDARHGAHQGPRRALHQRQPLFCNTFFLEREILSQMKNSQSTAKDTQLPDTLTKLPEQNRTEQTETKEWDLHSLWARDLRGKSIFGQKSLACHCWRRLVFSHQLAQVRLPRCHALPPRQVATVGWQR